MKYCWIAGRFFFAGLALVAISLMMGAQSPLFLLSSTPGNPIAGATDAASLLDDEFETKELPPAEDLVKDWERPDFTLFVTGRQHGYIEPCGCITLARQKGGLMRRHSVQKILRDRGWDLVGIDAGNQVRRIGQQPVIKLRKTYETLCRTMEYDMVGIGPDDLKLATNELVQTMDSALLSSNPFTCANVEPFGGAFTNRFVVVERNGKKIGVTMVVGNEHLEKMQPSDELQFQSVEKALQTVAPELANAKCDMYVLVAFTELERCRTLAKQFPMFDVLVTAGGAGDPTLEPEVIDTGSGRQTSMIQVGVKGMYVGLVGFYSKNGVNEIKYKRVQLDHRYQDSPAVKRSFKEYQDELKGLWVGGHLKDIEPREHPKGYQFVGSETCNDCHSEEYDIWLDGVDGDGGPHAKATRDLEENPNDDRVWVQRHYDPECMSCHATGWNPQKFYPYKTGLIDIDKQDHLLGNGCENCHGPGSAHVEMENRVNRGLALEGATKKLRESLALEMRVTLEEARSNACKECHDLDNSPDFLLEGGFDKYWPQIEHGGE